jgi:SAM-dependent methyltransferase
MASNYILGNLDTEIERLEIQASFFEPFARQALLKAKVKRGMRCADIGCGAGSATRLLAQMVGRKGHVTGADVDDRYLEYCRKVNKKANVDFVHDDIYSSRLSGSFDIVYSRFMFVHLQDPKKVIQSMKKLVQKGGAMIIQEVDHSPDSWLCYPEHESVDTLREIFVTLLKRSGGDPLVGRKLYKMMTDESLEVDVECYSPCLVMGREPYSSLGWRVAESIKPLILQQGLLSEKEYKELQSDLRQLAKRKDSFVTYARFFSVIGRK